MKINKKQLILKILTCIALVGVFVGLYFILKAFGLSNLSREQIQEIVLSKGAFAPLIFILISFLQVTFVPIPGAVTIIAGNYIFGLGLSFLYSYVGMLLGAMFAFALGKWFGRPFINWIVGSKEKVDEWLNKLKGREKVLLFFMFFFPFFPDDILCSIAGLLPISWFAFLVMQIVTRATSIGGTLLFMSGEIIPYHGWGLVLLGIICVIFVILFIVCYKNAEKINIWFDGLINKLCRKKVSTESYSSTSVENGQVNDLIDGQINESVKDNASNVLSDDTNKEK